LRRKKVAQKVRATSVIVKKLPKVNNLSIGENQAKSGHPGCEADYLEQLPADVGKFKNSGNELPNLINFCTCMY
jgi:hypothetical protein